MLIDLMLFWGDAWPTVCRYPTALAQSGEWLQKFPVVSSVRAYFELFSLDWDGQRSGQRTY